MISFACIQRSTVYRVAINKHQKPNNEYKPFFSFLWKILKRKTMKLELKHLAPYLPYKLKCEVSDRGEMTASELNAVYSDNTYTFMNIVESDKGFEEITPILRPMSDVESYFEDLYGMLEHQDVTDYFDADFLWSNDRLEINEIEFATPETLPFGTIQVLFKHHFDVFGLISKGLAVAYEEQERGQNAETVEKQCNLPVVGNSALCCNIKCTVDECPHIYNDNIKCPLHD